MAYIARYRIQSEGTELEIEKGNLTSLDDVKGFFQEVKDDFTDIEKKGRKS